MVESAIPDGSVPGAHTEGPSGGVVGPAQQQAGVDDSAGSAVETEGAHELPAAPHAAASSEDITTAVTAADIEAVAAPKPSLERQQPQVAVARSLCHAASAGYTAPLRTICM